jgi:hypothetical protein
MFLATHFLLFKGHPPDTGLVAAELSTFDGF